VFIDRSSVTVNCASQGLMQPVVVGIEQDWRQVEVHMSDACQLHRLRGFQARRVLDLHVLAPFILTLIPSLLPRGQPVIPG
jgi:hypothetical protein